MGERCAEAAIGSERRGARAAGAAAAGAQAADRVAAAVRAEAQALERRARHRRGPRAAAQAPAATSAAGEARTRREQRDSRKRSYRLIWRLARRSTRIRVPPAHTITLVVLILYLRAIIRIQTFYGCNSYGMRIRVKHSVVLGFQTEVVRFAARVEVERQLCDLFRPYRLDPSQSLCFKKN